MRLFTLNEEKCIFIYQKSIYFIIKYSLYRISFVSMLKLYLVTNYWFMTSNFFYRYFNNLINYLFWFNYIIRCKLADFGLARSLSQNNSTFESNGSGEEACLTDYVGKSNWCACNGHCTLFLINRQQASYTSLCFPCRSSNIFGHQPLIDGRKNSFWQLVYLYLKRIMDRAFFPHSHPSRAINL